MTITPETVLHISKLAHINLTPDEVTSLLPELESVLDYMSLLEGVNVSPASPDFTPEEGATDYATSANSLRSDTVIPSFDRQTLLSQAPTHDDEFFTVPETVITENP